MQSTLSQPQEISTFAKNKSKCLCNYSNDRLTKDELQIIETQCKKQNHLGVNDNLMDIIQTDFDTLNTHKITYSQIGGLFRKIEYHFKNSCSIKEVNDEEIDEKTRLEYNSMTEKYIKFGHGWCSWGRRIATIFNGELTVITFTWGGAEQCPFQNKELDSGYNGYKYGSNDILIKNNKTGKWFYYSDLLPHQIECHHFFQSPNSSYRISPEYLIDFFNIKPNIDYEPQLISESEWTYSTRFIVT